MLTKKIFKGSILEVIPAIIIAVIELFKIKFFIQYMGSSMNGYYQFINQIVAYLFLIEAGLSSAVIFKLYKPLSDKSINVISALYKGSLKIFRKIALFMIAFVIVIACVIPFVFKIESNDLIIVLVSFFLISFSYIISFLGYSRSLTSIYSADQMKYIPATIGNVVKIISSLVVIYLVIMYQSLILVAIVMFISKIVEEILIYVAGRRHYRFLNKNVEPDTSPAGMTKDLIWHQVGTLATNNVDSVVLMAAQGPVSVSIYASYNYVVRFLIEMLNRIISTITHAFGNVFSSQDKEVAYRLYKEYLMFCFVMGLIVSLTFIVGIRSFIGIWINDSSYILGYFVSFLFSSSMFITIIYSPLITVTSVNGLFKETKYYTLISALINFVLSIIFVIYWGLSGVLVATAISSFVAIIFRTRLVSKLIFKDKNSNYFNFEYLKFYLIFVLLSLLMFRVEEFFLNNISNLIEWLLYVGLYFISISLVIIFFSYLVSDSIRNTVFRIKKIIFESSRVSFDEKDKTNN